ncbi:UDP-N-acetylglucosamine 1-carboxyvinyltransferase [Desulfonispora thiosulfatigenes DSM 11270]|uniref:UDP-N-acetylglucosamine 1-carboxyvinyltransferase n=1 Tax=Desulfonispora thiosulfatigenes DSM 11270 TaxID=656914 RepID=A0A1W1VST9_DESTI|nr:UDP-N-acetylglucosamine 1-carboxyvinyltransferase [Desulfonispora thiosulfatigenes]SMB96418.1 UDP-N-acetylglucosamine 1-carboxyvinyltransferase [Desulfonispora thiosulfatigenes DSM 11270]
MEKFIIVGGNPLSGSVEISGAKNAVLPILSAAILSTDISVIKNVPRLKDVYVMKELLELLGCKVEWLGSTMKVDSSKMNYVEVPDDLIRRMRASSLVMGPLLARFGRAKISYPGGCAIGCRPIDLHLKGFKKMGVEINEKFGFVEAKVHSGYLKGSDICLDFPSVGATENLMMAASLAVGETIISNAAKEPEIVDLQNFLNSMGAKIQGAGTDIIRITGVSSLHSVEHSIIADRIEAGTFMIAAALTKGNVKLENVQSEYFEAINAKLRDIGVIILEENNGIRVIGTDNVRPVDIKTIPYPGFPTDMQPQFMSLLSIATGTSIISESIFENRFMHVPELIRMGADIKVEGRAAIIKGVKHLNGANVSATDLRAGAALILAGLVAKNETIVDSIYHIDRGYENIDLKLRKLGANIERVSRN